MSFLLKSPILATSLARFARRSKFAFSRKKIFPSTYPSHFKISRTFVRSYSLLPQSDASLAKSPSRKETLYQKSISQVNVDIKFKGYAFKEDIEDAWHLLKSTTAFSIDQTVLLIRSCGHSLPLEKRSEKLKLVKEIWDSFDDIGIKKTHRHYNALLDVYNELEHKFCPQIFLSDLEKQGLTPVLETYKRLLHALGIQGKIGDSQEILEHMKRNSVTIDDGVFNSLILGHSLQGEFISARGILELMKEKGLMVSSESYVSLALGYAKLGDIDKVKEIVEECKEQNMNLSPAELLEVAYTFAVNKHSEHFSTILNMITWRNNFLYASTNVVHRLLHQNLDKEAAELFELCNKSESVNKYQEPLQIFLDHYIRFRTPDEVFNKAEIYQEKGWSSIALAYCIKETLIQKDVSYSLNFLQALKTRGYPLRIHYFYPILVKAHRSGNEEVLKMLQEISKYQLVFNSESCKAFNKFYDFLPGEELKDLEKIKAAGVNERYVGWKILDLLFYHKNIDDAVKLVSTYKIAHPTVFLPFSMAFAFSTEEADHEKFVYILYYLIHNYKANKIIKRLNPIVDPSEYEKFLIEMAKVCDQTFSLRVMEEMLKKKLPLSLTAGTFIKKKFPCQEVNDLVTELTSADMKLKLDESLIKRLLKIEEPEKQEVLVQKGKNRYWSELEEALQNDKSGPELMRIFEKLIQKADLKDKTLENILEKLFSCLSLKGDVANTERIYEFGVQNKFFNKDNYGPCVTALLIRERLNDAVSRFYQGLKATMKVRGLETLISEIKKKKNFLALNDVKVSVKIVLGEYLGTAELLKAFANAGFIGEMTKILQSKTPTVKTLFSALCRELYLQKNVEYLGKIERASREIPELSFNFIYYQLLNLYVLNGDLEKILKLYVELERDDCLKKHFQKILFYHLENWNHEVPEKLKNVFQCILKDCSLRKSLKDAETVSQEENVQDVPTEEVQPSSDAKIENIPNASNLDLFDCYCLIQAGKLDEYFKILREKIAKEGPQKAEKYFFCYKLAPHFVKNPEYLKEYEKIVSLAGLPSFWKKYLKLCIHLGNIREVREAMIKLGSAQIRNSLREISFKDCSRVINMAGSHKILGEKIADFYSLAISTSLKENEFERARKYFEKAKKNKLEFFLSNSLI